MLQSVLNDRDVYWVWSPKGPAVDGVFFGFPFERGIITAPVCSRDAESLRAEGYTVTRYESGLWFSHWDNSSGYWEPVFAPVESDGQNDCLPSLAGVEPPDRLPDEYLSLFRSYTPTGRRKRRAMD